MSLAETFDFIALRFHFRAAQTIRFAAGSAANRLRGALGRSLKNRSERAYEKWFAPSSVEGPSGLRDRPRPFVLRAAHLDGATLPPLTPFCAGLNVFDAGAVDDLSRAMCEFAPVESIERRTLSFSLAPRELERVRVRFLTPTELKGAGDPDFPVLWSRLRDRISTLRALYGAGPLAMDFKAASGRAAQVRMTRCELEIVAAERVSRSTGQRHSLGGFLGLAEYEGRLDEFVPYLEIGQHTGVGRQTVWGKGEIRVETF